MNVVLNSYGWLHFFPPSILLLLLLLLLLLRLVQPSLTASTGNMPFISQKLIPPSRLWSLTPTICWRELVKTSVSRTKNWNQRRTAAPLSMPDTGRQNPWIWRLASPEQDTTASSTPSPPAATCSKPPTNNRPDQIPHLQPAVMTYRRWQVTGFLTFTFQMCSADFGTRK